MTFSQEDYGRAEREIYKAIEKLEEKVQKAVENEVANLFHDLEHHEKLAIAAKANKAVKEGAKKVKQRVEDHDHGKEQTLPSLHHLHHYPYDWPHEDPEHRILHAIESAEKAMLHAVQDEVENLFHGLEIHDDRKEVKKAKKALKIGVKEASKQLDDAHGHRRSWLTEKMSDGQPRLVEDYMDYSLE